MKHPHRHRRRRVLLPVAAATAALVGAGLTTFATDNASQAATARQAEALDRGVVSVHTDSGNLVSWRWLGTDPDNVAFNVYRAGTKVNASPVTASTNYFHSGAPPPPTTRSARSSTAWSRATPCTRSSSAPDTRTCRSARPPAAPTPTGRLHLRGQRRLRRRPGRRRRPRLRPEVAADQRQGQLPVRLHRQHHHRRHQARRHPALADRPRTATSARARTTPSSRCTTSTATARPRSP